jgi:hypothetical protein
VSSQANEKMKKRREEMRWEREGKRKKEKKKFVRSKGKKSSNPLSIEQLKRLLNKNRNRFSVAEMLSQPLI